MSSIDERIVQMRFDNQQFERGAKTSIDTLYKLKKSLDLDNAAKNVSNLQKVGNNFSLSGMAAGIETIANKFSTLGIIGVTALQNITTAAMNAGARIAKSLTIDPITTGLTEYETKMNAITTILTNTQSKGTTLDDVNKALSELNTYADQTIYNFAEMTRNIGTFTAAGVDLDTSVKAIKGIANLAAGSGSTAAQASTAMYQLSQAIAAGRVSLQDWNSVVNAGMGGELFQNALKETAKQMGIVVDESVSFRESISAMYGQESWLTSDVLVKTLESFADNETLVKAATQVKTITQLFDTMKESVQSGWAQSWEYIIGDRDQAIETLTAVSDAFNSIIQPSTDARNAMLKFWNQNGGRDAIIQAMSNSFQALADILGPIGKAFREVFPPMTGERLVEISERIKEVTENFEISDETTDKLQRTFRGAFSALDLFRKGIGALLSPITKLGGGLKNMGSFLLDITARTGDFLTDLNNSKSVDEFYSKISNGIGGAIDTIGEAIDISLSKIGGFGDVAGKVGDGILTVLKKVASTAGDLFSWISENVSAGDIFAGLAGGGIFVVAKKLSGFIDSIKESIGKLFGGDSEFKKIGENFSEVLSSVHDSINAFTSGIKATTLLTIAGAIGILSMSLNSISKIKATSIAKSLTAIAVMMAELNLSFRSISKTISKFDTKGIVKASLSMIGIAAAINILASAMEKIAALNIEGVAKGLGSIAVLLTELSVFLKATNLKGASLKGSVSLIAIAGALVIMSGAIEKFSAMSWEEIAKGLVTTAGALTSLAVAVKIIGKTKINLRTSLAIVTLAESCKILADALQEFGSMKWDEIARGLTAMGGALGELTITLGILGKVGGGGALLGGAAIFVVSESLDEIANALMQLGQMDWDEIGKGLTAMGGALAELGIVTGALGKLSGFSGLLGGGALVLAAQSLDEIAQALGQIGGYSWETIGKGLVGMGAALAELSVVTGALGKLAGFSGILGGGALVIAVQALEPIANTLERIGGLSWEEIARGLVGMGGALAELGIVAGLLGSLSPLSILGAGAILIGVQGLGTLADALQKFGGMSWEEITRGLVGMGGALTELAVVAGLLSTLAPLSALGSGSLLLGVQGLGDLADALKKFGLMDWDTIGRGLTAMGDALGETALGSLLNTFSGLGAVAISEVAEPLGTLAVSVSKWKNVTVPDGLASQLGSLADGVRKFTLGGLGAGALSTAAPGIGEMASAIQKWRTVSVPDGLEEGLTGIANGVEAFTFAFAGGWSIDQIIEPLGDLANTVRKWNGVNIPEGIGDGLSELADGVGAFTWTFAAGWSIGEIVEPLGELGSAVNKWSYVTIPEGIGDGLTRLANGIQAFYGFDYTAVNLSEIGAGLSSIGAGASSLAGINFPSLATGLTTFANTIKGIPGQISSAANNIRSSISGIAAAIASQAGNVSAAFARVMSTGLTAITSRSGQFTTAGRNLMMTFVHAITSTLTGQTVAAMSAASSLFKAIIYAAEQVINNSKTKIQNDGKNLIQAFINGMNSKKSDASSAVTSIVSATADKADDYNSSYYNAGSNAIQGLINGMNSKRSSAINTAANIAAAALQAAKNELDINSPSRAFEEVGRYSDEGMVNGLLALAGRVKTAGQRVGKSAMDGIKTELTNVANALNSDIDIVPTIRPVMDLSNISNGVSAMRGMIWNDPAMIPNFSGRNVQNVSYSMEQARILKQPREYGPDILDAFDALGERVDALGDRIAQMKMVLDTGAAVGGMSQKMDQKLGQMANYKGRNI